MENNKNSIEILILRALAGEASAEEQGELRNRIERSEADRRLFDQYKLLWQIEPANAEKARINNALAWQKINEKINLIEGSEKKGTTHHQFGINLKYVYAVSGIAALLLLFIGVYMFISQPQTVPMLSHHTNMEVPDGPLVLPDGSVVYFNGTATLHYPEEFIHGERRVKLEGSAWFEIAPGKPFIVEIEQARVMVLGTSFEIARKDLQLTRLSVLSGKVEFFAESGESMILQKNERVTFNKETKELDSETFDNLNFLAWKTGRLEYNEAPLTEVFYDLEQTYPVSIIFDEEIATYKLTARFINEKPEDIFKTLEMLFDLTIKEDNGHYLIKN